MPTHRVSITSTRRQAVGSATEHYRAAYSRGAVDLDLAAEVRPAWPSLKCDAGAQERVGLPDGYPVCSMRRIVATERKNMSACPMIMGSRLLRRP
jgi:hypothetical protein